MLLCNMNMLAAHAWVLQLINVLVVALLINVVLRCWVSNVHHVKDCEHSDDDEKTNNEEAAWKLMTASSLINLVLSFIYLGKMSQMKSS